LVIGKTASYWANVTAAVLITPFVFVAALPALLPMLFAGYKKNTGRPEIVLYWLCGWALWLSEIHRKDIYHLVFGSPLLIVLCVYYLEQYRTKMADLALQILAICAASLAGFNFFLVLASRPVVTRVGSVGVFKSIPLLALLEDKVPPGEEVFAYPYCPLYYFLSATRNPTRYSVLLYSFNTPSQFEEVIRVLDRRQIRYVLWDTSFEAKSVATVFPASPRMPPGGFIIEPYLESHYKLVKEEDGVRLLERNQGQTD
jgi:hypothetical protein